MKVKIRNVRNQLNSYSGMGGYCWFGSDGSGGAFYSHRPYGGEKVVCIPVPHEGVSIAEAYEIWEANEENE